jgi:hypothetical protein
MPFARNGIGDRWNPPKLLWHSELSTFQKDFSRGFPATALRVAETDRKSTNGKVPGILKSLESGTTDLLRAHNENQ